MKNYKGNMVLIELVIVILFFSLSSVVLLQVFARAQEVNDESRVTNLALLAAENAADQLSVAEDAEQTLLSLGFEKQDDLFVLVDSEGFTLRAVVSRLTQPSGVLTSVDLTASSKNAELFSLPSVHYAGVSAT